MSTVSAGSGATPPSLQPTASMRAPGVAARSFTASSVNSMLAASTGANDSAATASICAMILRRRGESRRKLRPMKK